MQEHQPYTAKRAPSEEAEKLQRQWLEKAKRVNAPDLLEYGRQQAERAHEASIKKIEISIDAILADPDAETEPRRTYHFRALNRSDADPAWLALAGFLQTTGPHRRNLENIALEYLCDEQKCLRRAARQAGQARTETLKTAEKERAKGITRLKRSKRNQLSGVTLLTRKRDDKPKNIPFPVKKLHHIAADFRKDLCAWAETQTERRRVDQGQTPHPIPPIQFDSDTLLGYCQQENPETTKIPEELKLLVLSPETDTLLERAAQEAVSEASHNLAQRSWDKAGETACFFHKSLHGAQGTELLDGINAKTESHYDREILEKLAEDLHIPTGVPADFQIVLTGPEGDQARSHAAKSGVQHRRDEEEDLEANQQGLTPLQRVERRASYGFEGPPLHWDMRTLQSIWLREGDRGRMPRHWYHDIPGFTTPGLREALQSESRLIHARNRAQEKLQDAEASKRTKGTLSVRRKDVREASAALTEAIALTDAEFKKAGMPQSPEPSLSQPDKKGKAEIPSGQLKMDFSNLIILEWKTKSPRGRKTRIKPRQDPQDFMDHLI